METSRPLYSLLLSTVIPRSLLLQNSNGVGRTGSFIGIYSQLERLKSEGEADLFQYIKSARVQRAGLILDAEQYTFCYRVLVDYLDSYDEYANFKS